MLDRKDGSFIHINIILLEEFYGTTVIVIHIIEVGIVFGLQLNDLIIKIPQNLSQLLCHAMYVYLKQRRNLNT